MNRNVSNEKLDVLQIVTQLEVAGAQSMARWLDDALKEAIDIETVFLYQKSESDLFPDPKLLVKERPLGLASLFTFVKKSWGMRKRRPDLVLAHTHYSIAFATLVWGFSSRTSIVPVHHWPLDRYPRIVLEIIRLGRRFRIYRDEVFVSPEVADLDRATVIPNPVPHVGPYQAVPSLPRDIVVVARHSAEKSLDTAIKAMKYLPFRHLTLVGGGDLTQELAELAEIEGVATQVTFAGRVANPIVRDMLRTSNVVLLPSLWEAMPVALLEAVAEDAVIVASKIGPHKFILDEHAAIGFTPSDPSALADAVARASDPSLQSELADGRDAIRSAYSEETIQKRWIEVLESVGFAKR